MTLEIVPSILAADFANLERALNAVEKAGARAVQVMTTADFEAM